MNSLANDIEIQTKKPRLGFLGVGWIGKNRMEAIAKSKLASIEAVADLSEENISNARQLLPHTECVSSIDALLESDLDGIVIATPSALHASQTIAALEKGVAVFCQKPLGRNAEETKRIIEVAKANDLLLGVDFSYRFTCFRKVYELVKNGDLGEIFAIEVVFHNAYGPDKSWFYNPQLSGGGCVIDLGVHLVDLALWPLGYPKVESVCSQLYSNGKPLLNPESQVEDYATSIIKIKDGPSIQLSCSWNLPAGKEAEIQVIFYGTKGGAAFKNANGSFYEFIAEKYNKTHKESLYSGLDDWGGRAAVDWVKKLAISKQFDPQTERVIEVAEVLDRIYERKDTH